MNAYEYIGSAERIRTHELRLKNEISSLQIEINSIDSEISHCYSEISMLESEKSSAYYTDSEGNTHVDYNRINSINARISSINSRVGMLEIQLATAEVNLESKERELVGVEIEKENVISEIKDVAEEKNENIRKAEGFVGRYAQVGAELQNTYLSSLNQLQQAANILGSRIPIAPVNRPSATSSSALTRLVSGNIARVGGIGSKSAPPNSSVSLNKPSAPLTIVKPVAATSKPSGVGYSGTSYPQQNIQTSAPAMSFTKAMPVSARQNITTPANANNTRKNPVNAKKFTIQKPKEKSAPKALMNLNVDALKKAQKHSLSKIRFADNDKKYRGVLKRVPTMKNPNVYWVGERRNSFACPRDPNSELAQKLAEFGVKGLMYNKSNVDFSPVSIDCGRIEFDADKLFNELAKKIPPEILKKPKLLQNRVRNIWQSMAKNKILDIVNKDPEYAKSLGLPPKDTYIMDDIEKMLEGYTLHESLDCSHVMIVPTVIHRAYVHTGGVAVMVKRLSALIK